VNHARGFTLIELAIVLVIITFLIGGLAMPLSAQIQARRIAETNKTLEEAREAIIGFAMSNTTDQFTCTCQYVDGILEPSDCPSLLACPRIIPDSDPDVANTADSLTQTYSRHFLPCPDTDNDGKENRQDDNPDACTAAVGLFPWVTLASAGQDAWGNRIRYAVVEDLANSAIGFFTQPIPSGAWNQVVTSTAQCNPLNVDVAADVPVVILSHGPNGRGARNISIPEGNATPAAPATTAADELQNLGAIQGGCTPRVFIGGTSSEGFDDLVGWISFPQLISRVCPAGGCP
jgi:prepilin-type N-terminal cleavage/methylation domain-containing protein